MPSPKEQELLLGYSDIASRFAFAKLEVLQRTRPWPNRTVTYFEIGKGDRRTDIVLSDEFVCDLPKTREHQDAIDAYALTLANRIRCGSPESFYCESGNAVRVEILWPQESAIVGSTLRSSIRVNATHLEHGTIAKCAAFEKVFALPGETTAFARVKSILNRVRVGIDRKRITFYQKEAHPEILQSVSVDAEDKLTQASSALVERFILGKAYWLAFRVAPKPGEVWIADPWDAEYLGITAKELAQGAYVLRARGLLELDSALDYARPSDKLLTTGWPAALNSIETPSQPQSLGGPVSKQWDAFISHASEDKQAFVEPLYAALTEVGLKIWYDKFELTVGDSLRKSIDYGLANSTFGIVVLSPRFFEKQWPQKELDGLDAREVKGVKVILPVWHEIDKDGVQAYSPMLAGRFAAKSSDGLQAVCEQLLRAMKAIPRVSATAGSSKRPVSHSEADDIEVIKLWGQRNSYIITLKNRTNQVIHVQEIGLKSKEGVRLTSSNEQEKWADIHPNSQRPFQWVPTTDPVIKLLRLQEAPPNRNELIGPLPDFETTVKIGIRYVLDDQPRVFSETILIRVRPAYDQVEQV